MARTLRIETPMVLEGESEEGAREGESGGNGRGEGRGVQRRPKESH